MDCGDRASNPGLDDTDMSVIVHNVHSNNDIADSGVEQSISEASDSNNGQISQLLQGACATPIDEQSEINQILDDVVNEAYSSDSGSETERAAENTDQPYQIHLNMDYFDSDHDTQQSSKDVEFTHRSFQVVSNSVFNNHEENNSQVGDEIDLTSAASNVIEIKPLKEEPTEEDCDVQYEFLDFAPGSGDEDDEEENNALNYSQDSEGAGTSYPSEDNVPQNDFFNMFGLIKKTEMPVDDPDKSKLHRSAGGKLRRDVRPKFDDNMLTYGYTTGNTSRKNSPRKQSVHTLVFRTKEQIMQLEAAKPQIFTDTPYVAELYSQLISKVPIVMVEPGDHLLPDSLKKTQITSPSKVQADKAGNRRSARLKGKKKTWRHLFKHGYNRNEDEGDKKRRPLYATQKDPDTKAFIAMYEEVIQSSGDMKQYSLNRNTTDWVQQNKLLEAAQLRRVLQERVLKQEMDEDDGENDADDIERAPSGGGNIKAHRKVFYRRNKRTGKMEAVTGIAHNKLFIDDELMEATENGIPMSELYPPPEEFKVKPRKKTPESFLEIVAERNKEQAKVFKAQKYVPVFTSVPTVKKKDVLKSNDCLTPHMCNKCWINDHMYCKNMRKTVADFKPFGECLHFRPCDHYTMRHCDAVDKDCLTVRKHYDVKSCVMKVKADPESEGKEVDILGDNEESQVPQGPIEITPQVPDEMSLECDESMPLTDPAPAPAGTDWLSRELRARAHFIKQSLGVKVLPEHVDSVTSSARPKDTGDSQLHVDLTSQPAQPYIARHGAEIIVASENTWYYPPKHLDMLLKKHVLYAPCESWTNSMVTTPAHSVKQNQNYDENSTSRGRPGTRRRRTLEEMLQNEQGSRINPEITAKCRTILTVENNNLAPSEDGQMFKVRVRKLDAKTIIIQQLIGNDSAEKIIREKVLWLEEELQHLESSTLPEETKIQLQTKRMGDIIAKEALKLIRPPRKFNRAFSNRDQLYFSSQKYAQGNQTTFSDQNYKVPFRVEYTNLTQHKDTLNSAILSSLNTSAYPETSTYDYEQPELADPDYYPTGSTNFRATKDSILDPDTKRRIIEDYRRDVWRNPENTDDALTEADKIINEVRQIRQAKGIIKVPINTEIPSTVESLQEQNSQLRRGPERHVAREPCFQVAPEQVSQVKKAPGSLISASLSSLIAERQKKNLTASKVKENRLPSDAPMDRLEMLNEALNYNRNQLKQLRELKPPAMKIPEKYRRLAPAANVKPPRLAPAPPKLPEKRPGEKKETVSPDAEAKEAESGKEAEETLTFTTKDIRERSPALIQYIQKANLAKVISKKLDNEKSSLKKMISTVNVVMDKMQMNIAVTKLKEKSLRDQEKLMSREAKKFGKDIWSGLHDLEKLHKIQEALRLKKKRCLRQHVALLSLRQQCQRIHHDQQNEDGVATMIEDTLPADLEADMALVPGPAPHPKATLEAAMQEAVYLKEAEKASAKSSQDIAGKTQHIIDSLHANQEIATNDPDPNDPEKTQKSFIKLHCNVGSSTKHNPVESSAKTDLVESSASDQNAKGSSASSGTASSTSTLSTAERVDPMTSDLRLPLRDLLTSPNTDISVSRSAPKESKTVKSEQSKPASGTPVTQSILKAKLMSMTTSTSSASGSSASRPSTYGPSTSRPSTCGPSTSGSSTTIVTSAAVSTKIVDPTSNKTLDNASHEHSLVQKLLSESPVPNLTSSLNANSSSLISKKTPVEAPQSKKVKMSAPKVTDAHTREPQSAQTSVNKRPTIIAPAKEEKLKVLYPVSMINSTNAFLKRGPDSLNEDRPAPKIIKLSRRKISSPTESITSSTTKPAINATGNRTSRPMDSTPSTLSRPQPGPVHAKQSVLYVTSKSTNVSSLIKPITAQSAINAPRPGLSKNPNQTLLLRHPTMSTNTVQAPGNVTLATKSNTNFTQSFSATKATGATPVTKTSANFAQSLLPKPPHVSGRGRSDIKMVPSAQINKNTSQPTLVSNPPIPISVVSRILAHKHGITAKPMLKKVPVTEQPAIPQTSIVPAKSLYQEQSEPPISICMKAAPLLQPAPHHVTTLPYRTPNIALSERDSLSLTIAAQLEKLRDNNGEELDQKKKLVEPAKKPGGRTVISVAPQRQQQRSLAGFVLVPVSKPLVSRTHGEHVVSDGHSDSLPMFYDNA